MIYFNEFKFLKHSIVGLNCIKPHILLLYDKGIDFLLQIVTVTSVAMHVNARAAHVLAARTNSGCKAKTKKKYSILI